MASNLWTGSFKSHSYPVYGNIAIKLCPLDQWGYTTTAKISFTGWASIVQSFFGRNMEITVNVTQDKNFVINIGSAIATLCLDRLPGPCDTSIHGTYRVVRGTYTSTGEFYLMLGAGNCEKNGCTIM